MKQINIISTMVFVLFTFIMQAQYKTVVFDYEKSWFNQSGPIPDESFFTLSGKLPINTNAVELKIFKTADINKREEYKYIWAKNNLSGENNFLIPVNYKLRSKSEYTFTISYFTNVTRAEADDLYAILSKSLESYINQSITSSGSQINFNKNPRLLKTDLDFIVANGLKFYRTKINEDFDGFSDIILSKIETMDNMSLKKAKFQIKKTEGETDRDTKIKYFNTNKTDLINSINSELKSYLNLGLLVMNDKKIIYDYPTKDGFKVLPLNFGYGVVYNSGNFSNLSYDSAPYAGVSFPLGKKAFASQFFSNSSISAGIFLKDFDFGSGTIETGPIFNKPIYLSYGYKTRFFVRFNAGAVFLQSGTTDITNTTINNIYVRPFVGVSFEMNVWAGFNKPKS